MLALAGELNPLAARADGVGQRGIEVQRAAHLVEVSNLDLAALAHRAAGGLQLTKDELEQRGLARAVGADQPNFVAAQDGRAEVAHDDLFAEVQRHIAQLADDLAAGRARINLEPNLTERIAPLLTLVTQHLEALDACNAAGTTCLDAFADPDLFLREQLVGARTGERVRGQLLFLHALVGTEVAGIAADDPAIEFDDASGHAVKKRAVVGDQHHTAPKAAQQLFQPGDGVEVEVVGRLIKQQHIGHRHQRLRQRHTLFHAAGELTDLTRSVQVQLRDGGVHPLLPVPRVKRFDAGLQRIQVDAVGVLLVRLTHRARLGHTLADGIEHAVAGLEHGLLRHVTDAHALRHLQQPVVEFFESGNDLQHRRLAGAVASDQAEPLAGIQREGCVIEQGHVAKGQVGIGKREDGHPGIVRVGPDTPQALRHSHGRECSHEFRPPVSRCVLQICPDRRC